MMEAIVAASIAVIAVIGLAHTFGLGRAFVNRFEVGRAAFGAAETRMAMLSVLPVTHSDLAIGVHPALPETFTYQGAAVGTTEWRVEWFDDPATPSTTEDLKRITTVVRWGSGVDRDSVRLTRLFLRQ